MQSPGRFRNLIYLFAVDRADGRQQVPELAEDIYHQRNLVETIFSVLKRRFGENLKVRRYRYQVRDIKVRLIKYNLRLVMKKNHSPLSWLRISTEKNLTNNI